MTYWGCDSGDFGKNLTIGGLDLFDGVVGVVVFVFALYTLVIVMCYGLDHGVYCLGLWYINAYPILVRHFSHNIAFVS